MRNRRKNTDWPRLEGAHEKSPELPEISAEHRLVLVDIYEEHVVQLLGAASDALAHEPEIAEMIATEFEHRTMRRLPASDLIGVLTAMRKRGLLPKVGDQPQREEDEGFSDINDVAS
jgi:adenosyl cobinamide kinase/adenosyl cobinamide phosphate guanylyltransferase